MTKKKRITSSRACVWKGKRYPSLTAAYMDSGSPLTYAQFVRHVHDKGKVAPRRYNGPRSVVLGIKDYDGYSLDSTEDRAALKARAAAVRMRMARIKPGWRE